MNDRILPALAAFACFGFIAGAVSAPEFVGTYNLRWLPLAVLLIYLAWTERLLAGITSGIGVALTLYIAWCLATVAWSLQPGSSLARVVALTGVTVAFVSAGAIIGRNQPIERMFNFIVPISVLAVLAGVGGGGGEVPVADGEIALYSGAVTGPNLFGMLQAMAIPLALWKLYGSGGKPVARIVWLSILLIHVVFLFYSGSRGSVLMSLIIVGFFLAGVGVRAVATTGLAVAGALAAAAIFAPNIIIQLQDRLIYKGASLEQGVLYSREQVWQDSLNAAKEGGVFGVGLGVSLGDDTTIGRSTPFGFSREKGNSQLGVIEETGLIGLFFYLSLIVCIVSTLVKGVLLSFNAQTRVATGLLLGLIIGLVTNSGFEAWWVAAGSPEFPFFFLVCGIGLGLAHRVAAASQMASPPAEVVGSHRQAPLAQ